MEELTSPLTLALMNDFPVIVHGVAELLKDDPRIRLVELDSLLDPNQFVDVVLYDAFASKDGIHDDVERLVADPRYARVAVYTWNVDSSQIREALQLGADGYLSKSLTAPELADALVRVHRGEKVVEPRPVPKEITLPAWPGHAAGLTPREAEVIALITQGRTNEEIAQHCYLSINSVKTYIRTAYRKMGVERRSQAVRWGLEHGLKPQPKRERLEPS